MNQQEKTEQQTGARDLLCKLYRDIGISALAGALEFAKRQKEKPIEQSQNPAVIREEKAA